MGGKVKEQLPEYMDARFYAYFEGRGWHAVKSWGEYQEIRVMCGPTYSLWDGERVSAVKSRPPEGLCEKCVAALTGQAVMEGMEA